MIAIIDSGGANIASIIFALERLGARVKLTVDKEEILSASHVILPGVGSAGVAMKKLKEANLVTVIQMLTQPVLGICLGMQLFYDFSEEDHVECLSIIPGKVKKLKVKENIRVPHMGWNHLNFLKETNLLKGISNKDYFYFVHSFFSPIHDYTYAESQYGENFSAVVQYNNFFGTQFHPERSGLSGEKILRNFYENLSSD